MSTSVSNLTNIWTTSTSSTNPYWIIPPSPTSNPYWTNPSAPTPYWNISTDAYINSLKDLKYVVDFDNNLDNFDLLEDNITGIKNNNFLFSCKYIGNRIQPYEFIIKLIKEKTKFTVSIHILQEPTSDILFIKYTDVQFIEIKNDFSVGCDFSKLKVKFKYKNMTYNNPKLSTKELRLDKLKKIKGIQE